LSTVASAPTDVEANVAPFSPAHLLHALQECRDAGLCLRTAFSEVHQDADAPNPVRLLRTRTQWPRRHAAETCDELAPSHCLPRGLKRRMVLLRGAPLKGWDHARRMSALGQEEECKKASAIYPQSGPRKQTSANRHVCFTPESRRVQRTSECPLWAKSGLMPCSNQTTIQSRRLRC